MPEQPTDLHGEGVLSEDDPWVAALWDRITSWRADCCADVPPCEYHQGCIDAVDSLGIERVPDLALSVTDERIEGVPFSIHRKPGDSFKGDPSICAEHEPVFRLALIEDIRRDGQGLAPTTPSGSGVTDA